MSAFSGYNANKGRWNHFLVFLGLRCLHTEVPRFCWRPTKPTYRTNETLRVLSVEPARFCDFCEDIEELTPEQFYTFFGVAFPEGARAIDPPTHT